jgi:hypothetical protein
MKLTNGYLGLVWEVPLGPDLGYGYARFTVLEGHFGAYVRILNHRSVERVKQFNESEFAKFDELVAPFLGYAGVPQRGDDKWKAIGYLPMKESDFDLPDLKVSYPEVFPPEKNEWFVNRGTVASDVLRDGTGEVIVFPYESVKHLGYYVHVNLKYSTVRVILEWMKILGMDYMSYENQDLPQDFLADQKYYVSVSVPYTEVPKEIRGKVIL